MRHKLEYYEENDYIIDDSFFEEYEDEVAE